MSPDNNKIQDSSLKVESGHKKPFMKKRPKARISIGSTYSGIKTSFIAQGVVVFREWDPNDKKFYYWEEWELTGFNDYDSWVEYDHYTKKISVYEPISIVEKINALDLHKGQQLQLTVNSRLVWGTVKEVGIASIDYLKGKMSYQLFEDDSFTYATISTDLGEVSIEDYRLNYNNEKDYYLGRTLTKKQQKAIFGKSLYPINWQAAVVPVVVGGLIVGPMFIPEYETVCTPRSASTSRQQASSLTTSVSKTPTPDPELKQDCHTRRVFFSGSGGGVGK
jgi:hypothetical protein